MAAEVIKIDYDEGYEKNIRDAASVLSGGGLVAFPTETVYGVAACVTSEGGVDRLRKIKQRRNNKPFTVHIGQPEDAKAFVPGIAGIGRRLATKGWPGPLTLIFHVPDVSEAPVTRSLTDEQTAALYHEGTVGLRCPDHGVARDLLTAVEGPVVAASANRAGYHPPICAEEVLDELGEVVDVVLDGGKSSYAGPSTIVEVGENEYSILREGVFDERMLDQMAALNILFVCTGNTCRSPMAVGLFRKMAADKLGCSVDELSDRNINIRSAGAFAADALPASAEAIEATEIKGCGISDHRSQRLTVELIQPADRIFVMTESHRHAVLDLVPGAASRTERLDPDGEIEDPIGGDVGVYKACAGRIEQVLRQRLEEIEL